MNICSTVRDACPFNNYSLVLRGKSDCHLEKWTIYVHVAVFIMIGISLIVDFFSMLISSVRLLTPTCVHNLADLLCNDGKFQAIYLSMKIWLLVLIYVLIFAMYGFFHRWLHGHYFIRDYH